MLSIQFVKNWKRWLCSPLEHQRPEGIDNTPFFCQHELLEIDPNCSGDLDSNVTVIQRDEWDVLNSMYVPVSNFAVGFYLNLVLATREVP